MPSFSFAGDPWVGNYNPNMNRYFQPIEWDKAPTIDLSAILTDSMQIQHVKNLKAEFKALHERIMCHNCSKNVTALEVNRHDYLKELLKDI